MERDCMPSTMITTSLMDPLLLFQEQLLESQTLPRYQGSGIDEYTPSLVPNLNGCCLCHFAPLFIYFKRWSINKQTRRLA